MFVHTARLQFESKPDKPDLVRAHKLQELLGGEMTVAMQYLFQGRNCRMPDAGQVQRPDQGHRDRGNGSR